jgi:putative phosphoribosyl transferase
MYHRPYYRDRAQAGQLLAAQLQHYAGRPDVTVLALPRGGVPVARPVAEALHVPLDVLIVCKVGAPGHEEYALGAVARNAEVFQADVMAAFGIAEQDVQALRGPVLREVERREQRYRPGRPPLSLGGRVAIVVDDGLATGATMLAAVQVVRQAGAARIVVAVPVGARDSVQKLRDAADEVICMRVPQPMYSVGAWYDRFEQVSDEEVLSLLGVHAPYPAGARPQQPPLFH